ncbi:phosphate-starvation-inducible PsiE family protein [Haloplanus pelagicus]|uniref:phosphate-starvation-inducible PsiE family protein n=1 Tax=Haloplanus pelagicus TaxID=2949995 RepID=UPI002040F3E8|nr:phosphate-starvation-inducible PsiE family protein [Haloplanus sp. HW8-1]
MSRDDGNANGSTEGDEPPTESLDPEGRETSVGSSWVADATNRFIHGVELVAAAVFALLFAIGVVDLVIQIVQAALAGRITDPLVVIGFIDTGLLLLIIVEVYETVIAYTEESETRRIVRLVIYTGVIAMVRKTIIFRTGEYATSQDALFAAIAYTILIFGLVALLLVERGQGERLLN